jgi:hypothetical protein
VAKKAKKAIEKGKALVQSKTFWFNILAVLIAIAGLFGFQDFEPTAETVKIIASIVGIGNIVLRLKTKQPITRVK